MEFDKHERNDSENVLKNEVDTEILDEFFLNHPAAVNKPYEWPEGYTTDDTDVEDELNPQDYIEVPFNPDITTPFVPPSQRSDAPLASILNPQLDGVDPRRWFHDFKPDATLRFSRIFAQNIKSSSKAEIWWPSKTFYKKRSPEERKRLEEEKKEREKEAAELLAKGERKKILELKFADPPTNPDDYQPDQEIQFLRPMNAKAMEGGGESVHEEEVADEVAPWRNGPARLWYERVNITITATHCDYGFKLKPQSKQNPRDGDSKKGQKSQIDPSAFLPVNLVRWEDDVVLDGESIRQHIIDELKGGKVPQCGWIPSQHTRTYEAFLTALKNNALEQMFSRNTGPPRNLIPDPDALTEPTPSHSIFPSENVELLNYHWENDIIFDPSNMERQLEPKVLTLDYNDDPLLFGMPEDRKQDYDDRDQMPQKPFDRKEHQFTKKSKMILGQVQQRQKQEEEEQMETQVAQMTDKDPFNLSNDDYYLPKAVTKSGAAIGSMQIQHSIPAQNIHRTFFPTHLTTAKLRHWHRHPINRRIIRNIGSKYMSILPLTKHIKKMEETRERQKQAEGGGDIFFMRDVNDLSGRDGDLILLEYSEEHPPLLSQPGMASKLRNYYKRKTGKEHAPDFDFGEMAFTHNSPFLGSLNPGQALQSIENNLYRAPIYRHNAKHCDFLLIRCKQGYFIRKCPPIFVVGQECPLYEIPSPNSKKATLFVRDFLLAFIYRLFWASEHKPRRLKMEDIKAAFPHYAESSVRKRLKVCSDFKRLGQGPEQNYWVLRPDFRLPSKEEVLSMVTPEMCCAQYSMLAAEQRLKDAGYGEKYFFTPENEENEDDEVTIEDEIKCAPWNTTRAFLSAMRGKCILDQTSIADPTGNGQGFSYVRVSAKPVKEEGPSVPKKLVTGTNADLRKLPLKEAKEICREYGVKEEEINSLSRWEIIDVIRTLSTNAAKASGEGETSGMARFARGNIRFNFADMQEKYKKHCQRIFDLQNQTLSNRDELSTDEGSSGEDSDNEELATRLENMLQSTKGKKGISMSERQRLEFENEEKERRDLKRMIHGDAGGSKEKKEVTEQDKKIAAKVGEELADSASKISGITANQKLKIYRTIRHQDGTESTRVEVITRPQLIEAYARIRMTKDESFIQVYAHMDEQYKEERRKEKRRLQDQLRRLKRNQEKQKEKGGTPTPSEKKPIKINPNLAKMKCSACGGMGHMKTNKNCPLYGKETPTKKGVSSDDDGEKSPPPPPQDLLTEVEGMKLKINKKILEKSVEKKKTKSTIFRLEERLRMDSMNSSDAGGMSPIGTHFEEEEEFSDMEPGTSTGRGPRMGAGGKRRTSSGVTEETDYLHGPTKSVQRIRADPKVTLGTLLTEIVTEMKTIPGSEHLIAPVNAKKVKDYYDIIKDPMDLQQIKQKIANNRYELRKDFLLDIKKLLDNSRIYNGDNHIITEAARKMFEVAGKRIVEKESKLVQLEKTINPLLDDNDRVGFCYILGDIVQKLKNIPKSGPFHKKVDPRKVPTYYERIDNPMDLETMERYAKTYRYTSIREFKIHVQQMYDNSYAFNGAVHAFTAKAQEIVDLSEKLIDEQAAQLAELEANINGFLRDEDMPILNESDGGQGDITEADMPLDEDSEGVLLDDLALSGNEMDDDRHSGLDQDEVTRRLLASDMHTAGQLNNDLALSDSDDDSLGEVKRPRIDDDLDEF